jgi:hypothetical protein
MTTIANTQIAGELAAVRGELSRVDAKCGTLAGLAGAALAFLVTQTGHGPLAVRILLGTAGAVMAAATMVLLLAVLRPRLGSTGFRRYAVMSGNELADLFTRGRSTPAAGAVLATSLEIEDLQVLSQIVNRKFLGLRLAVDLIAFSVLLMTVALLAGVIA